MRITVAGTEGEGFAVDAIERVERAEPPAAVRASRLGSSEGSHLTASLWAAAAEGGDVDPGALREPRELAGALAWILHGDGAAPAKLGKVLAGRQTMIDEALPLLEEAGLLGPLFAALRTSPDKTDSIP